MKNLRAQVHPLRQSAETHPYTAIVEQCELKIRKEIEDSWNAFHEVWPFTWLPQIARLEIQD